MIQGVGVVEVKKGEKKGLVEEMLEEMLGGLGGGNVGRAKNGELNHVANLQRAREERGKGQERGKGRGN